MEQIGDPIEFVARLGGLHDVEVERVEFDPLDQTLVLVVSDINANFAGLPDYKGSSACRLIFGGVKAFAFDVETEEAVRISRAAIAHQESSLRLEADLNLGGGTLTGGRRSIAEPFDSLRIETISPA